MRVGISGASGFIGSALRASLAADGHSVRVLVRRPAHQPDEVSWDPDSGKIDPASLDGLDAVVNLNGAPIAGRRWSAGYKKTILASRTNAAHTLATTIVGLEDPPPVFISASGVGYYGLDHGSEVLDEREAGGSGFLAMVVEQWEDAAHTAADAGVSVINPRFGQVIGSEGGVLKEMLPFFRRGLGGTLAGGEFYWSPVSLVDTVRALRFLIETPGCTGPYNVTAPNPLTNAEFSRVLGDALNRPSWLPVPLVALQIRYGEVAEHLVSGHRAVPRRLLDAGFDFLHPDARSIVAAALPR